MTDSTCDFCSEIHESENSTFYHLYGKVLPSRIVLENQHFICIPTIGQLIDESLLILPKEHLFTLSSMHKSQIDAFQDLIAQARAFFNYSIVFEHGCWPKQGHNCGVYHAHAHIIPVLASFPPDRLLPNPVGCSDLDSCFEDLKEESEYALYVDSDGVPYYLLPNATNIEIFKSQYFRKWLTSHFQIEKEFDWKNYTTIQEKELIDVIKKFRSEEISIHTK